MFGDKEACEAVCVTVMLHAGCRPKLASLNDTSTMQTPVGIHFINSRDNTNNPAPVKWKLLTTPIAANY